MWLNVFLWSFGTCIQYICIRYIFVQKRPQRSNLEHLGQLWPHHIAMTLNCDKYLTQDKNLTRNKVAPLWSQIIIWFKSFVVWHLIWSCLQFHKELYTYIVYSSYCSDMKFLWTKLKLTAWYHYLTVKKTLIQSHPCKILYSQLQRA